MQNDHRLQMIISDKILEVANCYNDATTSDLQAMAEAAAKNIIRLVRTSVPIQKFLPGF